MNPRSLRPVLTLLLVGLLLHAPARAGSTAAQESRFDADQLTRFAKQVERSAAAHGARVFIIARVGEPPDTLPDGVDYTHTGLAVYSTITTADGRQVPGYVTYNLYQAADDPSVSRLVRDYPAGFFAGVHVLQAGVAIPSPALQRALLEGLAGDIHHPVHNPEYSLLSNPFDARYQNCTEYTLDLINAAIYDTTDRGVLKANARAYFEPQPVEPGPVTLLLGQLFRSDLRLADQTGSPLRIATFNTLANYLGDHGLLKRRYTVHAQP